MFNAGFIPLRGGSKGIKNKNLAGCAGKPLVYYALLAAQNSILEKIYVSTDSNEIKSVIESFEFNKVEVISRSPETASDSATSESALIEFAKNYEFDNVVFIQATSPLITPEDINGGLERFLNGEFNSVISAVRNHQFLWSPDGIPINYDPQNRPRRQDWQGYYIENGAFYISSRKNILQHKCRITPPVGFWEMNKPALLEIDTQSDLEFAEKILKILH